MYRNYREYMQIAQTKPTQSERVSHLLRIASSTHEAHSKLVSGLVFAILTTSQSNHESLFQELSTIVRDQFNYAIYLLIQLTNVNFKLLRQQTLERIVFITDYMVQKGVMQSKDIFLCLLQQVSVIKTDEQSVS